jgi:hypothetical protein
VLTEQNCQFVSGECSVAVLIYFLEKNPGQAQVSSDDSTSRVEGVAANPRTRRVVDVSARWPSGPARRPSRCLEAQATTSHRSTPLGLRDCRIELPLRSFFWSRG